jgi:hypothetical protein
MKKPRRGLRTASRVHPTCARKKPRRGLPRRKSGSPDLRTQKTRRGLPHRGIKKPISGRPGIGAHFVSFNFPNATI